MDRAFVLASPRLARATLALLLINRMTMDGMVALRWRIR
jgi:hypothetical protein